MTPGYHYLLEKKKKNQLAEGVLAGGGLGYHLTSEDCGVFILDLRSPSFLTSYQLVGHESLAGPLRLLRPVFPLTP